MNEPAMSLLVVGGARSGKSRYAQELAERSGLAPVFVATAEAWDDEMTARIRLHVDARDRRWRTVESPYDLGAMLTATTAPGSIVLVDCLTLWLSNLLLRGDDIEDAGRTLANSVPTLAGAAVFVTNEVGGRDRPRHCARTPLPRRAGPPQPTDGGGVPLRRPGHGRLAAATEAAPVA